MSEPQPKRLDGWKSIADHLGRDARTAQRWHRERGMPVHHVPGSRSGTVFAYDSELDCWLTKDSSNRPADRQGGYDEVATPATGVLWRSRRILQSQTRRYLLALAGVSALLAALGTTGNLGIWSAARSGIPALWELNGGVLSALDINRQVLWRFELPNIRDTIAAGLQPRLERAVQVDLNADGNPDAAATINYLNGEGRRIVADAEVFLVRSDGELLWRYRPRQSFIFGGEELGGPWRVFGTVVENPPDRSLWVSFIHRTWWPSFVVTVSAAGKERLAFVNSGHLQALLPYKMHGRNLMLAGGFNNESMLPALAAFDSQRNGVVVSPQTPGTPFVCESCDGEPPVTYVLFPRSDVNIALGKPFVSVTEIETPDSTGSIELSVRDTERPTRTVYRLSLDLIPVSVAFSDAYWLAHADLSDGGKIDHPPEQCPARHEGVTARVWHPRTGWKDVRVPPTFTATQRE